MPLFGHDLRLSEGQTWAQRLAHALRAGIGLATALGIPTGLGLWYFKFRALGVSWLASVVAVVAAILFATAWFLLEGAGDIADEADGSDAEPATLFSLRVRPKVLIAFFIILLIGGAVAAIGLLALGAAT